MHHDPYYQQVIAGGIGIVIGIPIGLLVGLSIWWGIVMPLILLGSLISKGLATFASWLF